MNPWGTLESRSFAAEIRQHRGAGSGHDAEFVAKLANFSEDPLLRDAVRLDIATIGGERHVVAWDSSGRRVRFNHDLSKTGPIDRARVEQLALQLRADAPVEEAGWLEQADAYYYSHHDQREFPVYRIRYTDGEHFYLDGVTGDVVYAVDKNRRIYRWLHYGLHRGDFSLIRSRPVWDILMLLLLAGVTVGAITGTWIGLRRLQRLMPNAPMTSRQPPPSVKNDSVRSIVS